MTETIWIAISNSIVTIVTIISSVVMAYIVLRTKMLEIHQKQEAQIEVVKTNIIELKAATDGMKDELVNATRNEALIVGEKIGKNKEHEKQIEINSAIEGAKVDALLVASKVEEIKKMDKP